MTTSKRLSGKKVAVFEKNITKRGSVPDTRKGSDFAIGPVLLGLLVFVVVGSSLFLMFRFFAMGKGSP